MKAFRILSSCLTARAPLSRRDHGAVIVAVMLVVVIAVIMSAGLLAVAGTEARDSARAEAASQVAYAAGAALEVARATVVGLTESEWQALFTTTAPLIDQAYAPDPRVRIVVCVRDNNDDGDGDLSVDADGKAIFTAAAYGPNIAQAAVEAWIQRSSTAAPTLPAFSVWGVSGYTLKVADGFYADAPVHVNGTLDARATTDVVFDGPASATNGGMWTTAGGYSAPAFNAGFDPAAPPVPAPDRASTWANMLATAQAGTRALYFGDAKKRMLELHTDGTAQFYTLGKVAGVTTWVPAGASFPQDAYDLIYTHAALYVRGQVGGPGIAGRLTVTSEAEVRVNGNITTYDPTRDVLGIQSRGYVYFEVRASALGGLRLPADNAIVSAAIMADTEVRATALTSSGYRLGTLTVFGSIASGGIAGGSGALVHYGESLWASRRFLYDSILATKTPPFFGLSKASARVIPNSWRRLFQVPVQP